MHDGHQRRSAPRLVVHRDALRPDELARLRGVRSTVPGRIAYDLARRAPDLTEAVVAVDAVCHRWELDPAAVLVPVPGARGVARVAAELRARGFPTPNVTSPRW